MVGNGLKKLSLRITKNTCFFEGIFSSKKGIETSMPFLKKNDIRFIIFIENLAKRL